jgi:hypothetical protein
MMGGKCEVGGGEESTTTTSSSSSDSTTWPLSSSSLLALALPLSPSAAPDSDLTVAAADRSRAKAASAAFSFLMIGLVWTLTSGFFSGDADLILRASPLAVDVEAVPELLSGFAPPAKAFLKKASMPSLRSATGWTKEADSVPTFPTSCGTA